MDEIKHIYEIVNIETELLNKFLIKFKEGKLIIESASQDKVTQYHLAWITSFTPFINEIDKLGALEESNVSYSDCLAHRWRQANFGFSNYDVEKLNLTREYIDAVIFGKHLSILLTLESGKAKILKTVEILNKEKQKHQMDFSKIFIVHGHDESAKSEVARFIETLGLKPIILHEQASSGNTIIEKIEKYSNVGFGIVLYTPCDIGANKREETNLKSRARQNVVFEHGYLIGKIGRNNVCALVKGDLEKPNDISGVIYVNMDDNGGWKLPISKELKNVGYKIDMNLI